MQEPVITGIVAALVAGATAQASKVASQAVTDAYKGLKKLIIAKLGGKKGAVQSVEDEPTAEEAQANLIRTLGKAGLQADPKLKEFADRLAFAVAEAKTTHVDRAGNIDVGDIRAKVNATVERLAAQGHITLGKVIADGNVSLRDLSAEKTVQINKAKAGHDLVTKVHTNIQAPKSEAFEEIIRNFMVPPSNFLGEFFSEFLRQRLTLKEKENVSAHMHAVKERLGSANSGEATSRKFAKFGEWAAGASDVDPDKQPDASTAWRVALDEIISQSDYRMLNIVNNLQANEIMSISGMLENSIHDSNLGDRLKSFGIARRDLIEAPTLRRSLRISFFFIAATAIFFILSEMYPYFQSYFDTAIFARLVQISKWATLFVFILYTIYAVHKNFDKISSYRLTDYGIRIANKIRMYNTAAGSRDTAASNE
jgi:hypothetical protein